MTFARAIVYNEHILFALFLRKNTSLVDFLMVGNISARSVDLKQRISSQPLVSWLKGSCEVSLLFPSCRPPSGFCLRIGRTDIANFYWNFS